MTENPFGICITNQAYTDALWYGNRDIGKGLHDQIEIGNWRWININDGSQSKEAKQRMAEVRAATNIRIRHMRRTPPGGSHNTDDGMWRLAPATWVEEVVKPNGYIGPNRFPLYDNEFSTGDEAVLEQYLQNTKGAIEQTLAAGGNIAVLSTPSHWPVYNENSAVATWLSEGRFDDLFQFIAERQGAVGQERIIICPNSYHNAINQDGPRNVVALYDRFAEVTGRSPHMIVGEFAFGAPLDANGRVDSHGGYLKVNMSPEAMVADLVNIYQTYFAGRRIFVLAYTVGYAGGDKVVSFAMPPSTVTMLARQTQSMVVTLDNPPDPKPEPPSTNPLPTDVNPGVEDPRWKPGILRSSGSWGVRVRLSPSTSSLTLTMLSANQDHPLYAIWPEDLTESERKRATDGSYLWWPVKLANNEVGWARNDVSTIIAKTTAPDPDYVTRTEYEALKTLFDAEQKRVEGLIQQRVKEALQEVADALTNAMVSAE